MAPMYRGADGHRTFSPKALPALPRQALPRPADRPPLAAPWSQRDRSRSPRPLSGRVQALRERLRAPLREQDKRIPCKFWQEGRCDRGKSCLFAHEGGDPVARGGRHEAPLKPLQAIGPPLQVKRTICGFWKEGKCTRGSACGFAHGDRELGQPVRVVEQQPLPMAEIPPSGEVKRTICSFWLEGKCARGTACGFAHGDNELGKLVRRTEQVHTPQAEAPHSVEVKRTICKFWQDGQCTRGPLCGFAHGDEELGTPVAVPEEPVAAASPTDIKRQLCKHWLEGECVRGSLCGFAHGEEEIGQPQAKRTMCQFWLADKCTRGELCGYAHGEHEIGQPPVLVEQILEEEHVEEVQEFEAVDHVDMAAVELKRTICKFWSQGACHRGHACGFAHGEEEIGQPVERIAEIEVAEEVPMVSPRGELKRTLCKFWLEGACARGRVCGYAHGQEEIGQPEVKRTICKFWVDGHCAKGEQCGFAHGDHEIGEFQPVLADEQPLQVARVQPHPAARDVRQRVSEPPWKVGVGVCVASRELNPIRREEVFPVETKRTICGFWLDGKCTRGESCGFAHGEEEIGKPIPVAREQSRILPLRIEAAPAEVKRTLCKFWLEGHCERGSLCGFAHGEEDIGQPVLSAREAVAVAPAMTEVKRTICAFWREGKCTRGSSCGFAHGEQEIGLPIGAAATVEEPEPSTPVTRKRTVCKFWLEGTCKRDQLCGFAHGEDEIGQPVLSAGDIVVQEPVVTNVKRTICKFWSEGNCARSKCGFAHGEHEMGEPVI